MQKTKIIFLLFSLILLSVMLTASEKAAAQAAENGDIAAMKVLLEKNPKWVNAKDEYGNPGIHRAAIRQHTAMVEFLIKNGVDMNATREDSGTTTLHTAALYGPEEVVKLLVENGADIDRKDKRGQTPLNLALMRGRKPVVEYLMGKGATLNKKIYSPLSLLHMASATGVQSMVDALLKENKDIDFQTKGRDGTTLMHSAASGGLVEFVRLLSSKGLKMNVKNIYGQTPMHYAAQGGHHDVLEIGLKAGVDIDIKTHDGRTPLHFAHENKKEDTVAFLKKKGAYSGPRQFPRLSGPYLGQKGPGMTPEVFAPGIISSNEYGVHSYPAFSPDLKEVFWSAYVRGNQVIYRMKEEKDGWTAPETAPFSGKYHDGNPCFSVDGKRLYFDSKRPMGKEGKEKDSDIWYVERTETGWSAPVNAGPVINSEGEEKFAALAGDGTMYFKVLHDLYRARKVDGKFSKAEALVQYNTKAIEVGPFIAPDESFLMFESNRPGGLGALDLYISFRKADGTWTDAANLGETINNRSHQRFAGMSPEGKYFFFNTDRDIYWMDAGFIKTLKPQE